ncbi:WecB/TagA/CpsF family glycosyltransferase [Xylophilus rhododendri]|uniref:WecB/TagA/CpsF family glycosyltransferase n=1 Tax=Xylophilus rhododendri TaxID=2697032 RepID=A0A857JB62_9BURK|nr:WecB/TagA/CpsF family glycosyltransferase [Xylophilus rhododendri]QHI99978.1 WecB/TagA/CpsF family glycosyltransferase [Xylophilus rhododendri]
MSAIPTSSWRHRWLSLVEHIRQVPDESELQLLLDKLERPERAQILAFVNAHAMNSAAHSPEFHAALLAADLVLRDGSGMATLYRMLGREPGLNLNGTDLIPRIMAKYDGKRIALFGTRDEYASRARDSMADELTPHSQIDSVHGFHDLDIYVAMAMHQRPDLIVLGMGMPKQELLAVELRKALKNTPCLIICGGAIIDFLGGKTTRAPQWVRNMGCEWVFRLALEPRRLFMRYVVGNPVFLMRATTLKLSAKNGASGISH